MLSVENQLAFIASPYPYSILGYCFTGLVFAIKLSKGYFSMILAGKMYT